MNDPLVLDAQAFRVRLMEIADAEEGAPHIIGQTRALAERYVKCGSVPEGATITFHDEDGNDAYCLCEVRGGKLVVVAKTFGNLMKDGVH